MIGDPHHKPGHLNNIEHHQEISRSNYALHMLIRHYNLTKNLGIKFLSIEQFL